MGIFNKLLKKNNGSVISEGNSEKKNSHTLKEDILIASDWVVKALNSSGYKADYSLESMKEIDRFFDEQNSPTGILSKNRGYILFSLGSYIGETAIKLYGGEWNTDDDDPQGEIKISVRLANGTVIWPVMRCMKRYENGGEESIYAYFFVLSK
ncbi:MAG: hypothetical protein HDR11_04925 [Lachnospiraceae bacterium]|nr:hypothetical protein [Lachnospiraceae bacterium]MBD5510923.1 hypothetical protein [Lachnospiraceae bacterium]